MNEYNKVLLWLIVIALIILFTILHFNDKLQKLEQKGTFTVVCNNYKYKDTTHDYVGYDCKLLGGIINE